MITFWSLCDRKISPNVQDLILGQQIFYDDLIGMNLRMFIQRLPEIPKQALCDQEAEHINLQRKKLMKFMCRGEGGLRGEACYNLGH